MFVLECIRKLLAYYHDNKLDEEILQFYIQAYVCETLQRYQALWDKQVQKFGE